MQRTLTTISSLMLVLSLAACDRQQSAETGTDRTATQTEEMPRAERPPVEEPTAEPGPAPTGDRPANEVRLEISQKEPMGQFLTDAEGRSLYVFEEDTQGQPSTCLEDCARAWPPLVATGNVTAGEQIDMQMLSRVERPDGQAQVTYNGWPLYYYARDQQPGDTTGHDLEDQFGEWYLISPQGEMIHPEEAAASR